MTRPDTRGGPPCLAPTPDAIARAAGVIRDGGLVGLPTDTVYGLAADATSDAAVAGVFRAKGRPADKPLIALIATMDVARSCGAFSAPALTLAEAFWPGPLTLVLPRAAGSPALALWSTRERGASRCGFPATRPRAQVVEAAGRPVTAPSANPSGAPSPLTAADVAAGLGSHVALIVDGGRAADSLGSTLLDLTGDGPRLLRAGVLSAEAIEGVIGPIARAD